MDSGVAAPTLGWDLRKVRLLLQAEPAWLSAWANARQVASVALCVSVICVGAGLYGAAMGSWWAPLQAVYVAIKLPLLILLTTIGNGLLNSMLAPLLGLKINFRQTQTAVLLSFAIAAAILGALSPVALFVVWNTPPLTGTTRSSSPEYCFLQLTLVVFIAVAGVVGNVRLLPLLKQWASREAVARRVLFAWLAGNLFLGSQICWVLRPFIWDTGGRVVFIGPDCFRGSFYETVFEAVRRLVWS
jgi:hypothetical protein